MVEADYTGVLLDGRYRVQARRGQGGMGTVYVAEHVGLGQPRAIKFLRADLAHKPGAVQRFLQEARVLSAMHHDNLVGVVDMGEHAGSAYYVMELLTGEDLRGRLRRLGGLGWPQTRAIALQVCAALRLTHARGVVHRDLKPENCFCVDAAADAVHIKVLDFGVAKVPREAGGASQLTGAGELLGTIGYMAPEQLEGQGDHRSDVYSLGVMMFEMLAGRPLHTGNAYEILARMLLAPAPALGSVCAVDPAIERLLATAVARDPDERFASIDAFAAAIAEIPVTAAPQTFERPASASPQPGGETTADGIAMAVTAVPGPGDMPLSRPRVPRPAAPATGPDGYPVTLAPEAAAAGASDGGPEPPVLRDRSVASAPGAPVLADPPVPGDRSSAILTPATGGPAERAPATSGHPVPGDRSAASARVRIAGLAATLLAAAIVWRVWSVDEAPTAPDPMTAPATTATRPASATPASGPAVGPVPASATIESHGPDGRSIIPVPEDSPTAPPDAPVPLSAPTGSASPADTPVTPARSSTTTGSASPAPVPSASPGAPPRSAPAKPPRDVARPSASARPLTREALRGRLARELAACGSPYVAEEITVRVTPGKPGQPVGLAAIADDRLAAGTVDCLERQLARVLAGLTEGVDGTRAFDVSLTLPRRGGG